MDGTDVWGRLRAQFPIIASVVCNIRDDWDMDTVITQLRLACMYQLLPDPAKRALLAAMKPLPKNLESIRAIVHDLFNKQVWKA